MVAFIVLFPFFSSFFVAICGHFNKRLSWFIAVLGLLGSFICSVSVFLSVLRTGVQRYYLGHWMPPIGIEYVVDHLNSIVLVMVSLISLLVAIYSKKSIEKELPTKLTHFYTLFVLLVTGLLGMTITGDVFNLYVLLEISALTSYALIALGGKRAYMATFNYLMMGSIGACFYLLGVGFLLIKTGTLNMLDLSTILPHLDASHAIFVSFLFILIGVLIKMALFPLHGWLPNAYTYAPTATSCLVAPLMTKVAVYVLIRMMFSVYSAEYVFHSLSISPFLIFFSVIAIISGSLFALGQKDLKKMLTYLIVAEIGYMVGGIWLGNIEGLTGATYHIIADGLMTACLFMSIGCIIYKTGSSHLDHMKGLFKKMPFTMIGFTLGAFSMIGIPPTCGFFSKWYLLSGAYQAGHWPFFIALLFSSLINAVIFFRIIEVGFFSVLPDEEPPVHTRSPKMQEAPWSMVTPLLITSVLLIVLGLTTKSVVIHIIEPIIPSQLLLGS